MQQREDRVLSIVYRYAEAAGCAVTTASLRLTGSGDTVKRLEKGGSISRRRADAIVEAAVTAWPATAPWPEETEQRAHGAPVRELNPTRLDVRPLTAPGSTKGRT